MTRGICDGWVVIEMGAGSVPAALAGMLLADNGARVLKIEPPDGDRLRHQHPTGFLVWNRGKESGVADTWGLGYEDLAPGNGRLVYCSISGFGARGPYAALPAYEGVVAAKAGL